MKKHAGIVAVCGLAALATGVYIGNTVTAQGNAGGAAVVARTRIAFLNLNEVVKAYPKFKNLQETMKQKDKFYMDKIKVLDDKLKELQKLYQNQATSQAERDNIEPQARHIKADMENITNEAKRELIKFYDDNMAQIFMEVDTVVREYATTNGIDAVIRYSEDWNNEYHKPENVVRRMNLPIWVMYKDNNLDITQTVSKNLNNRFANAAVAPPAGANPIQQTGATAPPAGTPAPAPAPRQ
ncbi:MAG TPA: OmpH family outer membrane protein [Gemmatales bacterium]|nr:OmpH family outer membrane protein [Gemmatales bacterium]HMP61297.1 OmpH family outer membrane protein [Gemmatales bacterium]